MAEAEAPEKVVAMFVVRVKARPLRLTRLLLHKIVKRLFVRLSPA